MNMAWNVLVEARTFTVIDAADDAAAIGQFDIGDVLPNNYVADLMRLGYILPGVVLRDDEGTHYVTMRIGDGNTTGLVESDEYGEPIFGARVFVWDGENELVSYNGFDLLPYASPQRDVFMSTVKRGYLGKWSIVEFAVRQIAKAMEELAELSETVVASDMRVKNLFAEMQEVGELARTVFDDEAVNWRSGVDYDKFCEELSDLQVVVFNAADAIGIAANETYSSAIAAVKKARADIDRGVRNHGG